MVPTPVTASPMEVVLQPPSASQAIFTVLRDGQEGYKRDATQVRVGDKTHLVPLGDDVKVPMAASTTTLQRITIGKVDYLTQVNPDALFILSDNPCSGWDLTTAEMDPNGAEPPLVTCAPQTVGCADPYSPSPFPGLADDPLCTPEQDRCALMTEVTIHGEGVELDREALRSGETFRVGPTLCVFSELSTAQDRVSLFPLIGAKWTVSVVDGKLSGEITQATGIR